MTQREESGASARSRIQLKTIALALCAVLAVIVAVQNTETVDTRLLFVTVSMPRALLLLVTLLLGVAVGLLVGMRMAKRGQHPKTP